MYHDALQLVLPGYLRFAGGDAEREDDPEDAGSLVASLGPGGAVQPAGMGVDLSRDGGNGVDGEANGLAM